MVQLIKNYLLTAFILISIFGVYGALSNWPINDEFIINDKIPEQTIKESINPYCNGLDFFEVSNLDFGQIKSLEVEIQDREGWYTNLFELSLEKTGGIEPRYKDNYEAEITVRFDDDINCKFSATVRISGDKKIISILI